jgi:hypothetical protein
VIIDTQRQLADIFTKPLDASHCADLWGGNWCLPFLWFDLWREIGICHPYGLICGEVGVLSCIFVSFTFLLHFLYTHLSHFASLAILACICLIMLIIVLG